MPGVSNQRKKNKEAAARRWDAQRAGPSNTTSQDEGQSVNDSRSNNIQIKLKVVKKKSQCEPDVVLTRHQKMILDLKIKEKERRREQTQKATDKTAELREGAKQTLKRRREIACEMNLKVKVRKLESTNQRLEETLESSKIMDVIKPSEKTLSPLSVNTEQELVTQSAPTSPTELIDFDFGRPKSAPPTPTLNANAGTRIKSTVGLSFRGYDKLRTELAKEGIQMPSPSTIQRKENRIYDDHYLNSKTPDFYGLIEKAVLKYDFSKLKNVRITIGGDGGGDGEKASVKIGCFFNDIPLPLSVKKFMIIWTYVGKECCKHLKPILKYIDDDILRFLKDGIMTKSGRKEVVITYVGDCKFECLTLSLQGGSALCACSHCIVKRSLWMSIKPENVVLRKIENIISCAEEVINKNGKPVGNASVLNYPLFRNIPITHFVPPPVHLLIALVMAIIELIRKFAADKSLLDDFLIKSGAKLHFPAKTYNGNECRKILHHFRAENTKRIIYDGFGKDLFEAASQIDANIILRKAELKACLFILE